MLHTNVRVSKVLSVLIALLMVLMSIVPIIGTATPGVTEQRADARTGSRGIQNMTLYLQNDTISHYVYDYSTTYVFNTNVGNRSNFFGDTHTVTFTWDITPMLAGDLNVTGDVIVRIYLNTVGVSVNGNLQFTIYDVSYKQDATTQTVDWSASSANTQVQIQSGVIMYSVTIPGVNHVFPAGHDISLMFSISGGASAYYGIWYGNATYDSRIEFQTSSHMLLNDVYTLNYLNQPKANFELNLTQKIVKIRANLSDPFGGYDVKSVKMTLRDPLNAVILNNVTMVKIAGTPIGFYSLYEYQWNYSSAAEGKYNAIVWAVDNNGYNQYYHRAQYNYGNYWKEGFVDFWIGGLPANYHVHVLDSKDKPLAGALVTADRGGIASKNTTDANGMAGMAVFPTQYTFKVYWQDIEVAVQQVQVVDQGSVVIKAAVFYPTIKVLDSNGASLVGASVIEIHPNGTVFLTPKITDVNGTFALFQAPGASYQFIVKWRDIEVANVIIGIDSNGEYTISAKVYTLSIVVHDSHGMPLGGAQVVITNVTTRIVFDSKLTDLQGGMATQQPIGTYDIDVFWAETNIGGLRSYQLTANAQITIVCDVFYVTIKTVDSKDVAVSDAQALVLSNRTGSLIDSDRTDDSGMATLRLPMGDHGFQVFWKDIMVANGTGLVIIGDIPSTSPYIIKLAVFYTAIQVVDSKDVALPGALVTVTEQQGGVFDFRTTDANGTVVVRVPVGVHVILVQWKGVDVAEVPNFAVTVDIPVSAPYIVHAAVYYMTVTVLDSKDLGVSNAAVSVFHQNGEVADAGLTGTDGNVTIRLPISTYDIFVNWKDILVGNMSAHVLSADELVTIHASIFYVTFQIKDSKDIAVDLAHVTVYYKAGTVFDSGITNGVGQLRVRLAQALYDVKVSWKDVEVANMTDANVTGDGTIDIKAAIFYITYNAVDSRGQPVEKALITTYYMSGSVMDSGTTSDTGVVVMRLPGTKVNVTVVWKGTLVYTTSADVVNVTMTKVLHLWVYYLTVQVKGASGEKIAKAVVTVMTPMGATYDAGKTLKNGTVAFRLAKGSYKVSVRFSTTYYMSSVDERQVKSATMESDQLLVFKLKSYPPPIYSTVAFGLSMFIVILIVLILVVYMMLSKKLRDAAMGREEVLTEARPMPALKDAKPHDKKVPEAPKDAPKKEERKEPSKDAPKKEEPKEQPKEAPKTEPKPSEPVQQTVKSKDDEEIDKALAELDDKPK